MAQTWERPEPPAETVRAVRTQHGTTFIRDGFDVWVAAPRPDGATGGWRVTWYELLNFATLTDVTEEIQEGGP